VFGLGVGPAPARFLVGLATLSLLADAAEQQPLLCIVDDAQWLDQASAQVLAFVGRRLLAERIAIVCAARTGIGDEVIAGFPELSIQGLGDSDARALLLDNVDQSSRWTGRVLSGGRLNAFKAAAAVGAGNGNVAPSVSLDSPAEGAVQGARPSRSRVSVRQRRRDPAGSFYANGFLVATDTTSPYAPCGRAWPRIATLTAVATDNHFATATVGSPHRRQSERAADGGAHESDRGRNVHITCDRRSSDGQRQ
jgi:hypothetical protein